MNSVVSLQRSRRTILLLIALLFVLQSTAFAGDQVRKPERSVASKKLYKAEPPFYSIRQLEQWVKREKVRAEQRLKALSQKGVKLTATQRYKMKEATEYLEALLFYLSLRAYPYDSVDWMAYVRAAEHRDAMASDFYPASGPRWEFVGPRNMSPPYRTFFGLGPVSGRVNAVAYHPTQSGVYYMGAPQGGLWRSRDSGTTWEPLSDGWQFLQVASIAIHPTNPNIIYVGTGDFQGWMRPFSSGIMKSTDGGQTWQSIGAQRFGYKCVSDILIDPENPNVVIVCTGWGPYQRVQGEIWRSSNGGTTWTRVNPVGAIWSDLAIGKLDTASGRRYYYAVGYGNPGSVLRSSDRGITWTGLTTPLSGNQQSLRIATSAVNPDRVYLLSGDMQQVWRSNNAGATWTPLNPTDGGFYQAWYNAHLHVSNDASNNDVLYLGLVDLMQHPGTGGWRSIGQSFTNNAFIHVDQHGFAVNPHNPNEALAGNDGGVYRLTYNPANNTVSFTNLNATMGITQFYAADFHPTDPTRMLGGAQDNATSNANGNLNSWRSVGGGDGGYCAYNPNNPNIQYATAQRLMGVYRTGNNWATSGNISPGIGNDQVAFIAPIAIHPAQPNHLLAGTNYLWRWNETTLSWTPRLGGQRLSAAGVVISIAGAPSNANVIYTGSNRGELWMTSNGGSSWRAIHTGNPSLPNRAITSIAVHPTNPYKIYVTLGGSGIAHVWRCDDTRANPVRWVNISGSGSTGLPDIHTNTIALEPSAPDRILYVGTDIGMFYTWDGGATWRNGTASLGMVNVQINTLKLVPGTRYLMAATYGRGMWRIRLPLTPPGDVDGNGCVDDADLLRVLFAFGQTGSGLPEDVNADQVVDDADLLIVLFNFGSGC